MKPMVKTFQDDIGLLNELRRLASEKVPRENLYVIAHDDDCIDCIVGDVDAEPHDLGDLVAERYNEKGDEFRSVFRRFGFDDDESGDLEEKLGTGKILLLIR